ncbi:MAG: hypothetical protein CR997_12300 [Acidobacteria bacterium]|nr:MAG: hypothetical protein CR997_12300 [Acidobacteriota bacterium]
MWLIYLLWLQCPDFQASSTNLSVQDQQLSEISGLVYSQLNPQIIWVHNDSGGEPSVFALNAFGSTAAVLHLDIPAITDVEDIATGYLSAAHHQVLFLGDIGDNDAVRSSIAIYMVAEPVVYPCQDAAGPFEVTLTPTAFHLTYPDGARDAETLLFDPQNEELFVVSKRDFPVGRLYRVPKPWVPDENMELEYLLDISVAFPVGGDVSHDGSQIVVKNYMQPFSDHAYLWFRSAGTDLWEAFSASPCSLPLIQEPQGEAIGFNPFSGGYATISEGLYPAVHCFDRTQPNDFDVLPAQFPGDFNSDSLVDDFDQLILISHWLEKTPDIQPEHDLIQDESIHVLDFVCHVNLEEQAECFNFQ